MAFVGAYGAGVAISAFLKAATPLGRAMSWAEVILGPATTVGSCVVLLFAAFGVKRAIRR